MEKDILNNINNDVNDNFSDGYDSNDEIKIEVTDTKNGNLYTHIYSVPFRPTHSNEKRLICFSIINDEPCAYGGNCTYAHSLREQRVDPDKNFIYQIILDKDLMNFFSMTNPKTDEIYKQLLFMTHVCESCTANKCTGGYNCRHGVNDPCLKICKNDLLTGQCLNKIIDVHVDNNIFHKIHRDGNPVVYKGCINGHHLTERKLLPYYKYVHQKENSKKNKYQSVRYIDINPLNRIFNRQENNNYNIRESHDSDESTDDEINSWFQKKYESDDEDN